MLAFTHFPFFIPPLLRVSSSVVLLVHISPGKAQFHIRKLIDTEWNVKSTGRILTLLNRIRHSVRVSAWHQRLVLMTDRHNMTEEQDRCAVIGGACLPAWLCSVTAADQGCAAPPRLEEWRDRRSLAAARAPQILWVTTTQISYTFTDCNIGLSFSTMIKLSNSWHALQCLNLAEFMK